MAKLVPAVVLADFIAPDDLGLIEHAGDARLAVEALGPAGFVRDVLEQHLEGDDALC